jgi:DNA polymerase-3 subunit gamma/tau
MREVIAAFAARDSRRIVELSRHLLDGGLDLGHFLQELATVWRNLFLLKQLGTEAEGLMEASREEVEDWSRLARDLPLEQIHAAWQMTLEGQRRVLHSLDPGLALELLLLNIAHLKELVFVNRQAGREQGGGRPPGTGSSNRPGPGPPASGPGRPKASQEPPGGGEKASSGGRDWSGFIAYVRQSGNGQQLPNLARAAGRLEGERLIVRCPAFWYERMREKRGFEVLERLAGEYFGRQVAVCPEVDQKNGTQSLPELKKKVMSDPNVQEVMQRFKAKVVEIRPKAGGAGEANGDRTQNE